MINNHRSHKVPYDDEYATCERTLAKLQIYSGREDPAFVTSRIGITPTHTIRVGEKIINPRNGRARVGSLNGWFLSSEGIVNSFDLRRHLDWLSGLLMPKINVIQEFQSIDDFKINVACIWWSKTNTGGGPTLWPEQMSNMAKLNLECSFEFSFFGDDSSSED